MAKRVCDTGVVVAGVLSGASAVLARVLLGSTQLTPAMRVIVALIPVPFFLALIWFELRYVRSLDEFHRGVILESLAIAFPLAIVIGVVVESLQKAGLLMAWTIGDLWPFMALTWLPALWIARRRYK
jgi:hypothetical protein